MAEFKLVIGFKNGKCVQKEVKDAEAKPLMGKKIGDKVAGDAMGFAGYEFEVSGGSDYCGFPMRRDVSGPIRKQILAICGTGLKKKGKGIRQRKTVAGNTIHTKISQVNLKVITQGKEDLTAPAVEAPAPAEGGAPAEAKAEEAKPEAKKEEPKAETKKEEAKPEEKKEEPKPEPKKEA